MIKKRLFKAVAMLTAVITMCSLFSGCKKSEVTSKTTKTENEAVVLGYPITKTPITLQYWVPLVASAAQYISSYSENEAMIELQKRTGITLQYIHPATGQEKEMLQLTIATGNIPDIIEGADKYNGGEFKGVDDGVFSDLTDLIPKYAPDYYNYVKKDTTLMKQITNDNGKMAAINRVIREKSTPAGRIMLRKDWLEELNLQIPKTIADYENVFKTIKEKKGIAPYILAPDGNEQQFVGAFGIWAGAANQTGYFMRDGKTISFGKIQPEYKAYLELMNKWYSLGYISKDFAGMKQQQKFNLFDTGKAAMYQDMIVATYNRAKLLNIPVTSAPYPRQKLDDILYWDNVNQYLKMNPAAVVSEKSKYKTEAVRFLNYGYTDEGSILFNYGVEGKSYVMENGVPKFTDYILRNPKFSTEPANYILKMHLGMSYQISDSKANPNLVLAPDSAAIRALWADDKNVAYKFRLPAINNLTADEMSKETSIITQVNTYCDEMTLKFILGVEPLSKFDDYVSQVKKMNIDEAVKINQAAYDRFINKK